MLPTYDRRAARKATNLTVNSELLRQARAININLSEVLEQALAEAVRKRLRARWLEENRHAIRRYNEHVDAAGVFSDGRRSF